MPVFARWNVRELVAWHTYIVLMPTSCVPVCQSAGAGSGCDLLTVFMGYCGTVVGRAGMAQAAQGQRKDISGRATAGYGTTGPRNGQTRGG